MKKFIWDSPYMIKAVLVDAAMIVEKGVINTVADEVWDKIKSNPHVKLVDGQDAQASTESKPVEPSAFAGESVSQPSQFGSAIRPESKTI